MKRIFSVFAVLLLLLTFSVGAYAEIVVDDDLLGDMLIDYITGEGHLSGTVGSVPDYTNANNTSISFYISDTGKVNVHTLFRSVLLPQEVQRLRYIWKSRLSDRSGRE